MKKPEFNLLKYCSWVQSFSYFTWVFQLIVTSQLKRPLWHSISILIHCLVLSSVSLFWECAVVSPPPWYKKHSANNLQYYCSPPWVNLAVRITGREPMLSQILFQHMRQYLFLFFITAVVDTLLSWQEASSLCWPQGGSLVLAGRLLHYISEVNDQFAKLGEVHTSFSVISEGF